eukprot:6985424-Pyramimonas_sp.AAC.1
MGAGGHEQRERGGKWRHGIATNGGMSEAGRGSMGTGPALDDLKTGGGKEGGTHFGPGDKVTSRDTVREPGSETTEKEFLEPVREERVMKKLGEVTLRMKGTRRKVTS